MDPKTGKVYIADEAGDVVRALIETKKNLDWLSETEATLARQPLASEDIGRLEDQIGEHQVRWGTGGNRQEDGITNLFRITGPLLGKSNGHPWISSQRASNTELLRFLCGKPEWAVKQTPKLPVLLY